MTPRRVTLRSGHRVLIRPIRPSDAHSLLAGFQRLSAESRHRRFLSPVSELSARWLHELTDVDQHTHVALVALEATGRDLLGAARFIRSGRDPRAAEVALTVIDSWHGRGLGGVLLETLVARAHAIGVERWTASVLAHNSAMRRLLRRLGDVRLVGRDAGVVELRVELVRPAA